MALRILKKTPNPEELLLSNADTQVNPRTERGSVSRQRQHFFVKLLPVPLTALATLWSH